MAERRTLWKRVSLSRKVNALSWKAAFLWTWAQPHLDSEGFIEAEADYLKAVVVPKRKEIREKEIPALVQEIIDVGLWQPFSYDGVIIVQEKTFHNYQTLPRKEDGSPRDETASSFIDKVTPYETHGEHMGNTEEPTVKISKVKKIKDKVKYKECVFLTCEEFEKLKDKYGEQKTEKAIEALNNYKMSKGKKYKSDYHAILRWVIDSLEKKDGKFEPL